MPNSHVHAPQGLFISGLLLKIFYPVMEPLGLSWTIPVTIGLAGYFSHMALDCVPHADTVVYGSQEDFDRSMAWDPKKETKRIGLWPVFSRGSRKILRQTDSQIADPPSVEIAKVPMFWAYMDVMAAFLFTVGCLLFYLNQPFILLCLAIGAGCTVLPDLVLAKPIHSRLIKTDLFWRLDYLHHWLHAPVMLRRDRVAGTIIQIVLFALFCALAWIFRPAL